MTGRGGNRRRGGRPNGVPPQLSLLAFIALVLVGILLYSWLNPSESEEAGVPPAANTPITADAELICRFLDVGQADAILVSVGDRHMLIDAGKNATAHSFVEELHGLVPQGSLDIVIGTHPHEDHIGGLDAVIDAFAIDTLLMPRATATTKTFEDVLDAMERNSLQATAPSPGDVYQLGDAVITVLAPLQETYSETNDYSISVHIAYGEVGFVLTGDAETTSEKEMLASGLPLSAQILKAGHHGSHSSSSEPFIEAVNPEVLVICCGTGNTYGHPHRETLASIDKYDLTAYRTDLHGRVTVITDGSTYWVETEREAS